MKELYYYKAKITRVVDGDTVDACVDLGFDVSVNVRMRLFGLDAPETYGVKKNSKEYKLGTKATEFVETWLKNNVQNQVLVRTYENHNDKYGRWLVEIKTSDNQKCLNEELVKSGHAVVYND